MSQLEEYVGQKLPSAYYQFITAVSMISPEGFVSDSIMIYLDADLLIEQNETYETKEYLPGYVGIGNDSGGRELLININEDQGS